jgi:hypothetical protein
MVHEGSLHPSINLTERQWVIVSQICEVLAPFKDIQLVLEGQLYVTGSLAPGLLMNCRAKMLALSENQDSTPVTLKLLKILTESFTLEFGTGEPGTVFDLHKTLAKNKRHQGFPLHMMLQVALDPRTIKRQPCWYSCWRR